MWPVKDTFKPYRGLRDTYAITQPFADVLIKLGVVKKPGNLPVNLVKYWRSHPWKEDYVECVLEILWKLEVI